MKIEDQPQITIIQFFLLIIFAFLFSFVVTDGIRIVVQKVYQMPNDVFFLAYWGDTFWSRIFASSIGCISGGFVLGTYLEKRGKIPSVLFTIPSVLLWAFAFYYDISNLSQFGFPFLAMIMVIINPISALVGCNIGSEYAIKFRNGNTILNIQWYHWLWILPIYLNKAISIIVYLLLILCKLDFENTSFISFFIPPRFVVIIILGGIFLSIKNNYELITGMINFRRTKIILFVIGHVLLLLIIYIIFFETPILFYLIKIILNSNF